MTICKETVLLGIESRTGDGYSGEFELSTSSFGVYLACTELEGEGANLDINLSVKDAFGQWHPITDTITTQLSRVGQRRIVLKDIYCGIIRAEWSVSGQGAFTFGVCLSERVAEKSPEVSE